MLYLLHLNHGYRYPEEHLDWRGGETLATAINRFCAELEAPTFHVGAVDRIGMTTTGDWSRVSFTTANGVAGWFTIASEVTIPMVLAANASVEDMVGI